MPHTTQAKHPLPALGRFCLSCAGTLACWCIWLALAALLAVQLYIVTAHRLPVPGLILGLLESRLAAEDLAVAFDRAQFDPTGRLVLESARVRLRRFEDPLVVADSLYFRKSPWSVLSGARAPDEIRLDGATLQLPAPLSPSGTVAPLLRDANAVLRIEGSLVHIDQLTFRLGALAVHAHGTYQLPSAGHAPLPLGEVIGRVLEIGGKVVRDLPQLDALSQPRLTARLDFRPGIGNTAELEFTADALRQPRGLALETGALRATTTLRLDGSEPRPLRILLSLASLDVRERLQVGGLHAAISTAVVPRRPAPPDSARLVALASDIQLAGETLRQPVLRAEWRRDTPLALSLATEVHGETLVARATADLAARTAEVELHGVVPPSLVAAELPKYAPRVAPYLRFLDPVALRATATFGPGWQFEIVRARVRGGRVDSNGVAVSSLRGRVDFDRAGNFLAQDAVVAAGNNHARGSYWMNFRSWEFRYLLTGSMQPMEITGWIRGEWWRNFWQTIRFPDAGPDADVDVIGNYRNATRTAYFGRTDAASAIVLGADFAPAHALVFVRPHFAHAFNLQLARAGGQQQASGWFKRRADPVSRELRGFEFDLQGRLDRTTLHQVGGPAAATLLEPWSFSAPPHLELQGRIDLEDGRSRPNLKFRGDAAGHVTYYGFPLQSVRTVGRATGNAVRLDEIEVAVAGGRGTAKADLDGEGEQRRLGFDLYVEAADLVKAIRAINDYDAARTPGERPASPNAELLKRASGGRLNFALSAQGRPGDVASFAGDGNLEISGAELGEVHLFGLLSQLLSSFSLNFSSLKLDTLRGSFHVAGGRASFPDIKVTGPTSLIEGHGEYLLLDRTLDFSARFKPYEQNRNLVTGVIGIVLNPLASILELRLTGPIVKPAWSFTIGASAARETSPAAQALAAPPAATPAVEPPKQP